MYSFRLMPINKVGGAIIPAQIAEKVQNKLFPEIEKKLQKIHNPSGTYLIYPSKKMWELKEDEDPYRTRYVHPRHVFEDRRIFFTGTLFLESYVDETHPAYKYIPNFDGFLPLICGIVDLSWEISKECSTEEIEDLITDKDLTALLLSPLCQFRICGISLSRIGNGEDSSSSEVAEKHSNFRMRSMVKIIPIRFLRCISLIRWQKNIWQNWTTCYLSICNNKQRVTRVTRLSIISARRNVPRTMTTLHKFTLILAEATQK